MLTPEDAYKIWANKNKFQTTTTLIYSIIWFILIFLICCSAHWTESTDANPFFINFNQIIWLGLWARCANYYYTQDQVAHDENANGYRCFNLDASIQILPAYILISRIFVVVVGGLYKKSLV